MKTEKRRSGGACRLRDTEVDDAIVHSPAWHFRAGRVVWLPSVAILLLHSSLPLVYLSFSSQQQSTLIQKKFYPRATSCYGQRRRLILTSKLINQ
ncbi:hypothetical protein BO86DRAFT_53075 [Aspergillus japonicus CBS 114.51]|uniref:Uncharacterized protein n=1 Tax=Aspergillus japonicus CBS 114.51 TaxID=1448312 RepID=A0A8T8WJ13_ASPJA|nr:hypothetical protein BO86DRAFT_53075 [Aspergillus japonicus CBS 114.51]RAH75765.1 hypothetical protein BO86DRAFT_53075 [Aspergillus japonicus CBS 114.51]